MSDSQATRDANWREIDALCQADGDPGDEHCSPSPISPRAGCISEPLTVIDRRPSYDDAPPAPFTAQPIGDYIVVKRIPEPVGLIVEADIAQTKPINCEVVAISAHPSSELARAALQSLSVGDKVLIRRYAGTEVKVNHQEYTLVIIFDVLLKLGE